MTFYIDYDLLRIVEVAGYPAALDLLSVRRNDVLTFDVYFVRDGVVLDPGADVTNLYFAAKTWAYFSQDPALVSAGPFTKTGATTSTKYSATVAFNSASLNLAFNIGRDAEAISAMAEFSWSNAAGTTWVTTERVACDIQNDIYKGVAATAPAQSGVIRLPGVTGLTGGGTTNLDGVVSLLVTTPQTYVLVINTSSQLWDLVAGTDAEDAAAGIVRPDDFHAVTNPKVFKRVG